MRIVCEKENLREGKELEIMLEYFALFFTNQLKWNKLIDSRERKDEWLNGEEVQ